MKDKPKVAVKLVKIPDPVHYRLKIIAVTKRMMLEDLIKSMLDMGIKMKIYDDIQPAEK